MKPYEVMSRCPKCLYPEADTEYEGPVEHLQATTAGTITTVEDRPEYLRRTCLRCGFQWKETVLDEPE